MRGDMDAYRKLVLHYGPSVRAYLSSRLNDYHFVEDISQDVFITAYNSLGKYKGQGKFSSWLLAIANHKVMDHLRKQYAKNKKHLHYQLDIERSLFQSNQFDSLSNERLNKLRSCLKKLPEASRTLITDRYINRESVISIAERLASTENAISSKLFRVRKNLKQCIEAP